MSVSMTLTLTLDGVTYGELYEFCDAARAAGVPPEEAVRCLGSDERGDRFEVELGSDRRRPGAMSAAARAGASDGGPGTGPRSGTPGSAHAGGGTVPPSTVADVVRSMAPREEDVDRVITALKDMRRFLR